MSAPPYNDVVYAQGGYVAGDYGGQSNYGASKSGTFPFDLAFRQEEGRNSSNSFLILRRINREMCTISICAGSKSNSSSSYCLRTTGRSVYIFISSMVIVVNC